MGTPGALNQPHDPWGGKVGRQPVGVPRTLRKYCLQQWYALADEALEDVLCDGQAMREFTGIDLGRGNVPDVTTLLKFSRVLEARADGHDPGLGQRAPEREGNADRPLVGL